ncbi:hypothetical protein KFD70_22905 [Bacillus pfraonensis]|uniref:hypothetical protein n=1 Tax=Bacillus pfraonensis TaxID=2830844 RepID=UPI002A58404F|nr:hypothetical protein [Bacillus pseudomycoides]
MYPFIRKICKLLSVFGPTPDPISTPCTVSTATFSNLSPIVLPSEGPAIPYPSSIHVTGLSGEVTQITVTLIGLTHIFPDDVDILLVGPQGQNVILMADAGGGFEVNSVILNFNDSAQTLLPDESQIVSGTFQPTNYLGIDPILIDTFPSPAPPPPYGSTLSVFNGIDPNGVWNLFVFDDFVVFEGSIIGWTLNITTTFCS